MSPNSPSHNNNNHTNNDNVQHHQHHHHQHHQQQQQQETFLQQPKTRNEFVKSLSDFFKRDLISIPLIRSHSHQQIGQRCGLKAATLELDTAAYPNIEYIAGNRLSIYPLNPIDHVQAIMKHLIDDISPHLTGTRSPSSSLSPPPSSQVKTNKQHFSGVNKATALGLKQATGASFKSNEPLSQFLSKVPNLIGREQENKNSSFALRLALTYLYDITTAPSRDLLRIMADCCSNKEHKNLLLSICMSDENWERWICKSLRTLKSTFDEFNSCFISAKRLLSELAPQQPRQYSISSIKSSHRFRTEIIVVQHKYDVKQINISLQNLKEREKIHQQDTIQLNHVGQATSHQAHQRTPPGLKALKAIKTNKLDNSTSEINQNLTSVRSLRSTGQFNVSNPSPISSQQVKRVPSFSGPVTSMYAMSSSIGSTLQHTGLATKSNSSSASGQKSSTSVLERSPSAQLAKNNDNNVHSTSLSNSSSKMKQFDGLCSNYLLSLQANDFIICEFVENPSFTLKGNRERPIIMIGQDVGCIAFRPFWQQRALEHDRAQIFYTLFKDLKQKKFGDMQLVCLTGNKCKIEDLFKREINSILTHKIISSASYINRKHLACLLDQAAATSSHISNDATTNNIDKAVSRARAGSNVSSSEINLNLENKQQQISFKSSNFSLLINQDKELLELGQKIAKLLIEQNGCLYTCCDPQMTQAIEILLVESIAKYRPTTSSLTRDKIMLALLPRWKGRKPNNEQANIINDKYSFKLENPFERAQIVQEIYDPSL